MTRSEQQLHEVYLPLMLMQARGKSVFRMFLSLLGRSYVFGGGKLPDKEMMLWVYWAEHAFIPMNEQIAQLIEQKEDLIDSMPQSFQHFLEYHRAFKVEHERWIRKGGEYQDFGNFPRGFDDDLNDRIGRLSLVVGWVPKFLT